MVRIVLKNGRILQYNRANRLDVWNGFLSVHDKENSTHFAGIALCDVARYEFELPCRIMRERPKSKLPIEAK